MHASTTIASPVAANDNLELVVGAANIARTLGLSTRRIYELSDTKALPGLLKIGSSIAVRKSRLAEWIDGLEKAGI